MQGEKGGRVAKVMCRGLFRCVELLSEEAHNTGTGTAHVSFLAWAHVDGVGCPQLRDCPNAI